MRYTMLAQLGDWTFYELEDHGFTGPAYEGRPLYGYELVTKPGEPGKPSLAQGLHMSLDRAIVAAISAKYTAPAGAGGPGVGTAGDWFCRMIGMDQLVAPDYQAGQKALQEVLHETQREDGPLYRRARAMTDRLEARGMTLAVQVHP